MSLNDSFDDLELYLKQVNDEITQVLEEGNVTYNVEADREENSTTGKTAIIEPSNYNNSLENGQWDTNMAFLQSFNSVDQSDIERLLTNYKLQRRLYDKHYNGRCSNINRNISIVDNEEKGTTQLSIDYTKWSNIDKMPTILEHDKLQTLSWLCWQQWQDDFRIDYSPALPVIEKVTVKVNKQNCSQLDRHSAEIEAAEACKWLRAAGFPQYAQMYEDMQFPIDIAAAQLDHPLLEPSVLQSLFRRLHILNRCADVSQQPSSHTDDSEDEQCALSDNWTYQKDIRRWSRVDQNDPILGIKESDQEEVPDAKDNSSGNINRCKSNNNSSPVHSDKHHKPLAQSEHKLLRRAASTRFQNHREGIIINDVGAITNVSDLLSKRRASIKVKDNDLKHIASNKSKKEINLSKCNRVTTEIEDRECISWNNSIEVVAEEGFQGELDARPIISLSCTQLQILRKLAVLKLTAHIEKYCPSHRTGWNWELPKFIKKIRNPGHKENLLLNLPLSGVLQKTGQPLPKGIQEALEWLHINGIDQVGLFRKPGVRSRISTLKSLVESRGENINFNDQQPYDVADMVKQYFRELPETVFTNKLSETFILIFQYVPPFLRREAVLCALLLMPDEHREILQSLLYFLLGVAKRADVNQMSDSNLAICFAPALFQYTNHSSFYRQGMSSANPRELIEIKAAQECLLYMLKNYNDIFHVPREFLNQCKLSESNDRVVQLSELGTSAENGWQGYMQECHLALLKEVREKNRGWLIVSTTHPKVELSYKKVVDGHPLRLWKVCVDIEAPPSEVLHRILRERHIWDDDLHSAKIIAQMNKYSEVFHYVSRNITPLPYVDYCVIRTWNTDLPRGTCAIVETSVEHPDIPNIPNTIRGIVLASRYLIEPGGSGRSRLLHLSRVDMKGRMPEWYHKNFGHLCAVHAAHIQGSFRQSTVGPESKV